MTRHVAGRNFQYSWAAALMEAMYRAQATGRRHRVSRGWFIWHISEVGA